MKSVIEGLRVLSERIRMIEELLRASLGPSVTFKLPNGIWDRLITHPIFNILNTIIVVC